MGRILKALGLGLGAALYLWFAGVRNAGRVQERKRARRQI
jgi:hypothetical protein